MAAKAPAIGLYQLQQSIGHIMHLFYYFIAATV